MDERENTRELVVVDVKRYKKVKLALKASEERYRQLFENVPIGIYRTTPDGRIIDANPALVKMLGYDSIADLSTRNLEKEYSNAGSKRADFIKRLKLAGEIKGLEEVWHKKDGTPIHVRENAKLIRNDEGQVFFEGTVEDITLSKLAEEAQRIRSQQLEILNRIICSGNLAESLVEMLESILDSVIGPLSFDTAGIYMVDPVTGKVNLLARRGAPSQFYRLDKYMAIDKMPFSQVLLCGQPVFVDNVREILPDLTEKWKWQMVCSIPLVSKGRVVGAMNVASRSRSAFTAEEKNILELIGKEAGTLISKLQTETALRESEKYYRTLIDTSPDVIAVTDLQGNLQMVNQRFVNLSGFYLDEIIGKNSFDFVADFDRDLFSESIKKFVKSGDLGVIEYNFKKKNGDLVPLELSASLLLDAQGKPGGLIGFGRDISERKQAESQMEAVVAALRDSENKYRELVENLNDVVFAVDPSGEISYISSAIFRISGYTPEEITGKNLFDFLSQEDRELYGEQMLRTVETGSSIGEFSLTLRDKSSRWVRASSKCVVENDKVVGIRGIMSDITESKEAEAKLLAYQEQLRALTSELTLIEEKERRRIASELHDQIGQNLALCKLKVAALEKRLADDGMKGELTAVRRLLECSIQDARSLIFDISPPILYELGLLAAMEWLAERMQEQFHIPIEFESRHGDSKLESDQQVILFQVVRELLMNVGKHSRATQAKVILSLEKQFIKIQVNDDGVGFDASQIYDAKDNQGGFGFFSMRERLNYLGGGLEVRSKPGQGSQIILSVPLPHEKAAPGKGKS